MMLEGGLGFIFKEDKIASAFVQTCILMQESKSIQQIIGNWHAILIYAALQLSLNNLLTNII